MMHWPIGHRLLGTAPLPASQWLLELGLSLSVLLAVELQKKALRHAAPEPTRVGRRRDC